HGVMAKLTLPGGVGNQDYYKEIMQLIKENEMKERIEFPGMVSQEELSALYRQADICFFSSHWQSGLSAVPMEAMACGCVVITYGNENSREIIEHNQTGFIVSEGDFDGAVSIIQRLVNDTNQYQAIIECALNEIDLKYTMERYVSEIEAFLCESLEKHQEKHNGNH
ncbi:MAG: glycosyltransferase, partial [Anaerolineaceae bacterium]|nr:glycosyltransferase [Anaerolineaceae bacterium]